jgi:uncharacterized protein YndB with AHSA1/START domain
MTVQTEKAQTMTSTDRIEKSLLIRAPRSRVWQAITNAEQFCAWFRFKLDGAFVAGKTVHGNPTNPGYEHLKVEMQIEKIEPERYFSYRWHPYPADPKVDYSKEPMTLVEFTLEDEAEGTKVTIVESGFDQVPLARRAEAFRMNDQGWGGQIKNLAKYVA